MESDERRRFEETTLLHFDAAYNLARWLTRNDHASEDIVQEAFCRAARYFSSFHGDDGRSWLLGIVRRVSFDWIQQRRSTTAFDDEAHDVGDNTSNPAFLAIRQCDVQQVRQAIEDLSPHLREVIVLREIEGLSYQQIATVTETPIGTVMSRISRGRSQLQLKLTDDPDGNLK